MAADQDPTSMAKEMTELLSSPELRNLTKEIIDNPVVRQKIDAAGAVMRIGQQGWLIRKVVGAGAIEENGEILPIAKYVEGVGKDQPFSIDDTMILSWDAWIPYRGDAVHHGPSRWSVDEAKSEIGMRVILPITGKIIDVVEDGDRPLSIVQVDDRFGTTGPQSFSINALLDGLVPAPFLMTEEEKREMFLRLHPGVDLPEDVQVEFEVGGHDKLRDNQGRTAAEAGFDPDVAYVDTDGTWNAPPAAEPHVHHDAPSVTVKDGPAIVSGDDA